MTRPATLVTAQSCTRTTGPTPYTRAHTTGRVAQDPLNLLRGGYPFRDLSPCIFQDASHSRLLSLPLHFHVSESRLRDRLPNLLGHREDLEYAGSSSVPVVA